MLHGGTIKQNYLNNRDLMKEIHLSKISYCSFRNPAEDNQHDIILKKVSAINRKNIAAARRNRAARILRETGEKISPSLIPATDLVFRIQTWEHIPMLPPKQPKINVKTAKNGEQTINKFFDDITANQPEIKDDEDIELEEAVETLVHTPVEISNIKSEHIRINFPPFFHYRVDEKGNPFLVGKSHWQGDLETGCFCKTHGELTNTLAMMIMKLAEKYASKGNWRGYSYREEMEGQAMLQLCQVVLQFDESKSSNPFSFLTTISHNAFLRILNLEKRNQHIRDKLLVQSNMNPSYSWSSRNTSDAE